MERNDTQCTCCRGTLYPAFPPPLCDHLAGSALFPAATKGRTGNSQRQTQCKAIFHAWRKNLSLTLTARESPPTLPTRVHHMWQRRKDLEKCKLFSALEIIRTWKWIVLFIQNGTCRLRSGHSLEGVLTCASSVTCQSSRRTSTFRHVTATAWKDPQLCFIPKPYKASFLCLGTTPHRIVAT